VYPSTAPSDALKSRPLVYGGFTFAYRRGEEPVVDGLSLELQESRVTLVTGPSGAGKTTICRAANGLVPHEFKGPMAGTVTIAGRYDSREYGVAALSKLVGVMSQDPETQLFNPTVFDEIAFGPCNYGLPPDEIRERAQRLLDLTRLSQDRDKNPHNLSGGQQQACALASILSSGPIALVLDEPTSNIDPLGSRVVLDLVTSLAREENRTTMLVEHKMEELVDLVDEMIVVHEGKVMHRGTVRDVLENVEHIASVGLNVPQVTLLAARLRSAGWPIERLPLGIDEAVEILRSLIDSKALRTSKELPSRRTQHQLHEVVVEVRDLGHSYPDGTRAISDTKLEIRKGEFLGILGQNGSGKTTLVKHFNGLLKPTTGSVRVAGLDTATASINEMAERVGFIFQNPDSQLCKLKVSDELAFGPQNLDLSEPTVRERVDEAAAQLEISHLLNKNPFFLSKGEKQRVAVASVMAMQPEILVLDEPTTGQDFKRATEIMDLAVELHEQGQTIVVITHDMNLAAHYCDRVIIMDGGVIALDASTREAFMARDVLMRSSLRPPQITELGRSLGYEHAWLTVDEAAEMLHRVRGAEVGV
jgi:energy-coupling factor transporter ATP-binding protein EcfA2